jgi:hypothetical protein
MFGAVRGYSMAVASVVPGTAVSLFVGGVETFVPVSLLTSILVVGAGTLLARWSWNRLRRPKLRIAVDGIRVIPSGPNDQTRAYRVRVENAGKRAAENCKPRVDLTVERAGTVTNVSSLGRWAERNRPTRTTINVGETAEFELLEYDENDDRIRFPSGDGTDSYTKLYRFDSDGGRATDDAEPSVAIGVEEIIDGTASERQVLVTAENASSANGRVSFDRTDGHLSVSVERSGWFPG